ncbi:HelD family protein [Enterococcus sp. AZ103]|uniref:HelD family protein n=1 Tax=Enterococcus sp. AZ103 TaxID=2774628 RepID=UPI003F217DE4
MTLLTEKKYLNKVIQTVQEKIMQLELSLDQSEQEYRAVKKYTVDYSHELDKYEVYNHHQNLKFIDSRNILESQQIGKLTYQENSPYFAKVVFQFDDDPVPEDFYIGRYGLSDELGNQYVYDWRAPIATLYYDFGLGKSGYQVGKHYFSGENLKKIQFDIQSGELVNLFNVAEGISDVFLTETLSKTSSQQMKNIIQTIQKEQNTIIRQPKDVDIIMQGVAGSGKTSIALHRLAYLLYQERETLQAENILILSPNKVFSNYIANVLPELGENDLRQLTFEELAQNILQLPVQLSYQQELATVLAEPDSAFSQAYYYKQSTDFEKDLTAFLNAEKAKLWQTDLKVGTNAISAEELETLFAESLPLMSLISKISRSFTQGQKKLQTNLEKSLTKRLAYQNEVATYLKFTQKTAEQLNASDLYPILYIKDFFEGLTVDTSVKYLVVDEMQDYTLLQFTVLQKLFSAKKIYCGDIYQILIPKDAGFLTDLSELLTKPKTFFLKKSYRSSFEIIQFAQQFVPEDTLEAIQRHGESVIIENRTDSFNQQIKSQINRFLKGKLQTCGIICQSTADIEHLQSVLADYKVQTISAESTAVTQPIAITSLQFAKGLEFDSVILLVSDKQQQPAFMYIGATRALHELIIYK